MVKYQIGVLCLLLVCILLTGCVSNVIPDVEAAVIKPTDGGKIIVPVTTTKGAEEEKSDIKPKVDVKELSLPTFESLDALLEKTNSRSNYYDGAITVDFALNEAADSAATAAAPSKQAEGNIAGDYSETNSQVDGVEEGEIVKTDGKYIYIAERNKVIIVKADKSTLNTTSTIEVFKEKDYESIQEIYVVGDRLVTVHSEYKTHDLPKITDDEDINRWRYYNWNYNRYYTVYNIYDITDRTKPAHLQEFKASGECLATRVIDDNLYYVTKQWSWYGIPVEAYKERNIEIQEEWFVPTWSNSVESDAELCIPATDIKYFPDSSESAFMLVGCLNLSGKDTSRPKGYFGGGDNFYMNTENLIIDCQSWERGYTTILFKFTLTDEGIVYTAGGEIKGYLNDQYSMDMYNGMFRAATSSWGDADDNWVRLNYLFVLDEDMKMIGSTTGFAKTEDIRSVRFMGEMCYVVTFRNTDPLFAIDLSDPKKPEILGELKIPGFSQYLHPIGDGLLVGFGRNTEEIVSLRNGKPEIVGSRDIGLKISLFDVNNPKDPREISKLTYPDDTFFSEAFENPRALMVNSKKGQFGFPLLGYDGDPNDTYDIDISKIWYGGMLIEVADSGNGAKELKELSKLVHGRFTEDDLERLSYISESDYMTRLLYIGETLYIAGAGKVSAFNYTSLEKLSELVYRK